MTHKLFNFFFIRIFFIFVNYKVITNKMSWRDIIRPNYEAIKQKIPSWSGAMVRVYKIDSHIIDLMIATSM
ncbi:unnamed protein product [Blepharisma stoltei]|uniref:Uncharacterized protein n=1 Tax=Blepharisma stoltei TaxID=1481888 RepID=A0AAU9JT28_9CILI|nr:unnamed protein product [Blepharisma stoltei]